MRRNWHLIDARGQIVGRLAQYIVPLLIGKHRPDHQPGHTTQGDTVVVINADKIMFSGRKWKQKIYRKHSGHAGGLKERTAEQEFQREPTRILEKAIHGMLPKNKLRIRRMSHLKCYSGTYHPHVAQFGGTEAVLETGSELALEDWEPEAEEMKTLWKEWLEVSKTTTPPKHGTPVG